MLLIERRHAEFLVHQRLVLAARWSIPIMRVVAEGRLVQVAECMWHDSIDPAKETLILCSQ